MRRWRGVRLGRTRGLFICALILATAGAARADMVTIDLSEAPDQVFAGTTFAFPVILTQDEQSGAFGLGEGDPQTLFVGYSLDVNVLADLETTGQMIGLAGSAYGVDSSQSNFFLSENFIAADPQGRVLHPTLSVINDGGDGGVFIRALEQTGLPVGPAGPGHNVLAELIFEVSPDAEGFFTLYFGTGTALLDSTGTLASFDAPSKVIEVVVPEPGTILLLAGTALLIQRKVFRK